MVVPGSKGQSVGLINTAGDFSSFFKPQQTQPVINQTQQQNYQQTLIPQKQQAVEPQQKSSFFSPTPMVMSTAIKPGADNLAKEPMTSYTNKLSEFKTNSNTENKTNLTPELVKTDSVKRAENNTMDIFQKNKELMSLQQKAKQSEAKKAPMTSGPTIINHYNTSDSSAPMNTDYKDPLENLKMQYRSYPAWRTQVG